MTDNPCWGRTPFGPHPCFEDFDVAFHYSRAQALAEGVLVDVSGPARATGFIKPVAISSRLWADIQAIPNRCVGQSVQGRLQEVLRRTRRALQHCPPRVTLFFPLWMPVGNQTEYLLQVVCGPGDDGQPVVTLLGPPKI